jgi:hypothetical protein
LILPKNGACIVFVHSCTPNDGSNKMRELHICQMIWVPTNEKAAFIIHKAVRAS